MTNGNGTAKAVGPDLGPMLEMAEHAREKVNEVAERAQHAVRKADNLLVAKVRENPLLVLGVAVGVGYVLGRLVSRFR
jgi:ElaB/YqjD/DUF883 family membrane-anchored ribosome-binding protein